MRKKFLAIMMSFAMIFSMTAAASFADSAYSSATKPAVASDGNHIDKSNCTYRKGTAAEKKAFEKLMKMAGTKNLELIYIKATSPLNNTTYYFGEKFTAKYTVRDTWEDWYTEPAVVFFNSDFEPCDIAFGGDYADPEADWENWTYTWKLSKTMLQNPGNYYVGFFAMPVDENLNYPAGKSIDEILFDDSEDAFDVPCDIVQIKVKSLGRPASVSATAGKGKVTVKWSGVSGAQKYKVYRSLSKSSGYKLVKTTTSKSYTNTGLKKGKRYYYKVKAVRTSRGTIYGAYSTAKRSGTVK